MTGLIDDRITRELGAATRRASRLSRLGVLTGLVPALGLPPVALAEVREGDEPPGFVPNRNRSASDALALSLS